jgi:CRP-like cAMP-binding protein
MVEGWAARAEILKDGGRQITAILLPGDFCDLHVTILGEMDHDIVALTDARVAYVPHKAMEELPAMRPELGRALWWATLVDEAVLRSWISNIGRRDAYQRLAHLFCELHARLKLVGLVEGDRFDLPMTQEVLADAQGLTPVHVNRTLQALRGEGLIELSERMLTILDVARLHKAAGFDPSYLHRGKLARR